MFQTASRGRQLSHDEIKAAEAAFQGRPFNEAWSQAARVVYDGMVAAIRKRQWSTDKDSSDQVFHELDETKVPVAALACTGDEK
ncbi:MAG TPA: hypothetical protein VJM82_08515 [Nitrospiraceae bacterium]|nr:hypothetical protein [Nitrospiraceae bacterium]